MNDTAIDIILFASALSLAFLLGLLVSSLATTQTIEMQGIGEDTKIGNITPLRQIIVNEINNITENTTGWVCKDYAEYYNQTLSEQYPELDIRWIRYVDICNNQTLCDTYHTYVLVNGYGSEALLDQKNFAIINVLNPPNIMRDFEED